MIITFLGHSELSDEEKVWSWLCDTLQVLTEQGAHQFLFGGYGRFDSMAASAVLQYKNSHPDIASVLIIPYLNRKTEAFQYDSIVYPSLEHVPRRYAILKRNEWMVDKADMVVAYVTHDWGGAAKALAYAKHKNKRILNFPCSLKGYEKCDKIEEKQ